MEYESQAGSNVTLRMPQVDRTEDYMKDATSSMMLNLEKQEQAAAMIIRGLSLPSTAKPFDIDATEVIDLPIVYRGPKTLERALLVKIAAALLQDFTNDVWASDTFSISNFHGRASVTAQSRISFSIVRKYNDIQRVRNPFLILEILHDDLETPNEQTLVLLESLRGRGVPYLALESSKTSSELSNETKGRVELLRSSKTIEDEGICKHFTVDEFLLLDAESASGPLLDCLNLWQERRHPTAWKSWIVSRYEQSSFSWTSILSIVLFLSLFCLSTSILQARSSPFGMSGDTSSAAALMKFHQVTETNALIELPVRYRALPSAEVPSILATVTRDGKQIKSRLQLVVDNLYALDWPQSEAHGELVVAAEMAHEKTLLQDAYVIRYSSKTPLLSVISEKLRGLNTEADFARRFQELAKQVEESRSYAYNISQHQLQYIKDHGSQGLKKIQAGYPEVLKPIDSARQYLYTSTPHVKEQSIKYLNNAVLGWRKLGGLVRSRVNSNTPSRTWWHKIGKSTETKRSRKQKKSKKK